MDPRIRYARTSDGVRIAYWAIGEGPPLLHLPWGTLSHCLGEWRLEGFRRWYERLARRNTVIRYDPRGCGMSDPMGGSVAVDDLVKDIEAVEASLGLRRVALLAAGESGNTAITYAAKHTDRLSHLVLWCCYARPSDREKRVPATRRPRLWLTRIRSSSPRPSLASSSAGRLERKRER